ncbi:hypothetical protein P261_02662 [Lachnospiraceae bacterium TWA4]|nr:hypothetical protein P261_02662 [Lachnospiraceae bacterium TWA4]
MDLITAIFTGVISFILFIYVSFTLRCKGPILSNTFLLTPKEDWDKIDKKSEYRMVSIVYGFGAFIFLFLTLYIITSVKWWLYVMFLFVAFDLVYVVGLFIQEMRDNK